MLAPNHSFWISLSALCLAACSAVAPPASLAPATHYQAIPLNEMRDALSHWRNRHGEGYAQYRDDQIVEIADTILLYQRDHGGWVENRDPTRLLNTQEIADIRAEKSNPTGSFDNRNIFSQINYLAAVFAQTQAPRFRAGVLRGLEFTLRHQNPVCGLWPHTVPGSQRYHPYITIADDISAGLLHMLRRMSTGAAPYAWLDSTTRQRAAEALDRGDACLLKLQIRQAGQLTGWAGQYMPDTLEPAMGRSFELAALASQETVAIVRYLMSIESPSAAQRTAIEAAIAWLQRSALQGWSLEKITLPQPIKYPSYTAQTDRRLVPNAQAPNLWARFYDLLDNSIVLANRDSVRVAEFSQISHERRNGYDWYGQWPEKLLRVDYPAWQARVASPQKNE